nr:ribosomal protein S1 [Erythrocladia irregularis]
MLNQNFLIPQKFKRDSLKTILQKYNYALNKGDVAAGIIFSKEKYGFLINIGSTLSGYLPNSESKDEHKQTIHETREFIALTQEKQRNIILSINKLDFIKSWDRIQQLYNEDITIYGNYIRKNKGGVLVDIEGILCFIPNSHNINPFQRDQQQEVEGKLPLKFLEINEKDNYVILSYKRVVLQSYRNKFNVGQIIHGSVQNIKDYGVFVDIGDATGLIHISEIAKNHINDLNNVFKIGDQIKVSIIHLDTKQGRISLSTKFLD